MSDYLASGNADFGAAVLSTDIGCHRKVLPAQVGPVGEACCFTRSETNAELADRCSPDVVLGNTVWRRQKTRVDEERPRFGIRRTGQQRNRERLGSQRLAAKSSSPERGSRIRNLL